VRALIPICCSAGAEQRRGGCAAAPPPGEARPHVCGCSGLLGYALPHWCGAAGGGRARLSCSPPCEARTRLEPHVCGRSCLYAAWLLPSEQWKGGHEPLPAGRSPAPGRPVGPAYVGVGLNVSLLVRSSGSLCRKGGLAAAPWRDPRRATKARSSTSVATTAYTLLGWCRAADGSACSCFPSGESLSLAGAPCERALQPICCLAGAEQRMGLLIMGGRAAASPSGEARSAQGAGVSACTLLHWRQQQRGGRAASPRRAKPSGLGQGWTPTRAGASAYTLPGWCGAAGGKEGGGRPAAPS
jgi:hypothetical protein